MASFWYTPAKERLAKGDLDFEEAGHDIRVMLCMTNTTADTDQDAATIRTTERRSPRRRRSRSARAWARARAARPG